MSSLVFYANINVCIMITALITLSRAIAIWNYSLAKKIFTWKKTMLYYAIFWIYSVGVLTIPLFSIWGRFEYNEQRFTCTFERKVKLTLIAISFTTIVLVLILRFNIFTFQNITSKVQHP